MTNSFYIIPFFAAAIAIFYRAARATGWLSLRTIYFRESSYAKAETGLKLAVVQRRLAIIYRGQTRQSIADLETVAARYGILCFADRRVSQLAFSSLKAGQSPRNDCERRRDCRLTALLCCLASLHLPVAADDSRTETGIVDIDNLQFANDSQPANIVVPPHGNPLSQAASPEYFDGNTESLGLFSYRPDALVPLDTQSVGNQAHEEGWLEKQPPVDREHDTESWIDSVDVARAKSVLLKKWRSSDRDPETLETDIDALARYLASQPRALEILLSLADQRLRFEYSPLEFRSDIKGTAFHVRSVTIKFDPRASAVLALHPGCQSHEGRCVASAADAFIHELIHAQIALLETEEFIRSGAMNSVVYPYTHEREVLKRERSLYQAMTAHDHKHRPQRFRHIGQLRASACVTCL